MKLKTWIRAEWGRSGKLARAVGISAAAISKIAAGTQPASLEVAVLIVKHTKGDVTIADLVRTSRRARPSTQGAPA